MRRTISFVSLPIKSSEYVTMIRSNSFFWETADLCLWEWFDLTGKLSVHICYKNIYAHLSSGEIRR